LSPEEFSDFYAASFRRLVGHLYAMTGDRAEAQDAVQEAFVRAWSHRGRLDRDGAPEAWVRATAWRIAVSRWHRARRGRLLLRGAVGTLAAAGAVTAGVVFGAGGGGHPAPPQPASRPAPATRHATRPALSTPVPVSSSASPSAVPTATASGQAAVPVPSGSG
jgi:DNA-directed RNA polymerase specialized sigma24 family protein